MGFYGIILRNFGGIIMRNMEFNANNLRKLFDNVDERIFFNKREKLEIGDGPIQQKKRAEDYVDAIAKLVCYILSTAKREKGKVRIPIKLKKYFGRLGSGTTKTPGSYYEIDEDKLTIVLDYSNEYHNDIMVTWCAKSRIKYDSEKDDFCSASGRIPLEQISNALNKYGFGMRYQVGTTSTKDKSIFIEVETYTIIVKRIKEKTIDSPSYIKK